MKCLVHVSAFDDKTQIIYVYGLECNLLQINLKDLSCHKYDGEIELGAFASCVY